VAPSRGGEFARAGGGQHRDEEHERGGEEENGDVHGRLPSEAGVLT
jgi:hypothetical protein